MIRRPASLASCLLAFAILVGCNAPEVGIEVNRRGDAVKMTEVVFEPTPVTGDGVYSRVVESDGKGHDKLSLKTKVPLRIRVIVEPMTFEARVVEPTPAATIPATQPFPTPRAVEP